MNIERGYFNSPKWMGVLVYHSHMQHIVFHEKCRGESVSGQRQLSIVGCDEWQIVGGSSQSLSWLPPWPMQWPREWEEEREKRADKQRGMARCGGRKKGMREKGGKKKKNVGWPVLISLQQNEGHGRRGRWVSDWEWSIIYLSSIPLTLIPLSFFSSISLFRRLCPAVSGFSWECSEGK